MQPKNKRAEKNTEIPVMSLTAGSCPGKKEVRKKNACKPEGQAF
ncbi:hypothetical protein [Chryseobacterium sp. SN22]|nr:hypothetical protein [Chryseobacterium sp. SN22]